MTLRREAVLSEYSGGVAAVTGSRQSHSRDTLSNACLWYPHLRPQSSPQPQREEIETHCLQCEAGERLPFLPPGLEH